MQNLHDMGKGLNSIGSLFERRFILEYDGNSYDSLIPIPYSNGFLNFVEYSPGSISPKKANRYFRMNPVEMNGMCSGVFRDGKVLRHFDWIYDDSSEFMVKMNRDPSRGVSFESIGMAFPNPSLSRTMVWNIQQTGMFHEYFDILPYAMVDGVNEMGIYVQSNVVPGEGFENVNINPGKEDCCVQMMLVRFLLDKLDKISNLRNVLDQFHLYSTNKVEGYGIHLMVADSKKSCVIEFENDHYEISTRYPLISNFRLNRGFKVQSLKEKDFSPIWETIEKNGMGVERWEIMADFLKNPEMDMFELRKKLNYTNSYDNLAEYPWVTEISHGDDMTTQKALDFHLNGKDSPYYDDYVKAMKIMNQKYRNRSRFSHGSDRTWQTVHSCIYDIENHSGQIQIQEGLDGRFGWNFKI